MVNYCCVDGCGRNSRQHSHLKYYSLPKEKYRQVQWLKAAGREDLLVKGKDRLAVSHRVCSRHFPPASVKNKHLHDDAIPTLNLSGISIIDNSNSYPEPHQGVICNSCSNAIHGFRYKCVTCQDFDLCQKCEMQEIHPQHFMLRMPKPLKFKKTEEVVKKLKQLFKGEQVITDNQDSDCEMINDSGSSSDDEPINKYVKNYDSGVDLSDDIKTKIRKEVIRSLTSNTNDVKSSNGQRDVTSLTHNPNDVQVKPTNGKSKAGKKKNDRKRISVDKYESDIKKQKVEESLTSSSYIETDDLVSHPPELAFADVNDMKNISVQDIKTEFQSSEELPIQAPLMHVKLSDDLTHLTIEMMEQ